LLGYKVHDEDPVAGGKATQATAALPANSARLHNIIHAANHMMSHILHFYQLVALDYVKPVAWAGAFVPLTRPFLAPRYDDNYYINTQRVLAIVGLGILPPAAVATLTTLPGWGVNPGDAINNYLVGQYLRALNIRRTCHELQAIFSGRAPQCNGWTPGGATTSFKQADINNAQAKLNAVRAFVGEPTDFKNGIAGTMMFDVVAAAHLFPEYFWIGNSYSRFIAWGWGEEAGTVPLSGALAAVFGPSYTNPDNRLSTRGYKTSAAFGAPVNPVDIMKIGESIASSRYKKLGLNYPDGIAWKHPWDGKTQPDTAAEYSWLKSPGYDTGGGNYQRFEVGPLSRMVVNGFYWAGILTHPALYPALAPVLFLGAPGPDCSNGGAGWGQALKPVYASLGPPCTGGPNLSGAAYTGDSTLDRIAARALECRFEVDQAQHTLNQLQGSIGGDGYGTTGITDPAVPNVSKASYGYGMTEASRGALSHWVKMKYGKIQNYQAVVPTTWNASPRDANGNPGPAEQSLQSGGGAWIADATQPIELPRITHSYDFCIACAVHLITPKGEKIRVDIPALPG
jgi:hydrogenase large subunit